MRTSIFIITLILLAYVIFLFVIMIDFFQQKTDAKENRLMCPQHFVGSWQYMDLKRKQRIHFHISPSYSLILNGNPIKATVVFVSPTLFIFKDSYGFTMKLHYFSEEYSYLYDEANERYYRVKKVSTTS
ncbi:DUF4828 domain-containing protein [Vagococcus lutrae]|uniref:DUF4828 domain-containing protein n=1 Tax=Vagococcus lutrae TaxID=81947 RepID=UPI00200BA418|nr:DUF4828 domain-containing protein [Vagococcus lutrae]UQF71554.1 DUF4828 domain-containing protein [Vagococcus lutrae]